MDEHAQTAPGGAHGPAEGEDQDPELSLRPYFVTIWRYRHVILSATVLIAALFAMVVLGAWLWFPTERISGVRFRLLFDGATERRYPNGAPFSEAEIVGTPVIAHVFKTNDLQRFGTYEEVKAAITVQQSSEELDRLAREYEAKLADLRIGHVDRTELEAKYTSARDAVRDPSFAVRLVRTERFTAMPAPLAEKILTDVVATWAEQAAMNKAVMKYPLPLVSSQALPRARLDEDDYLVAADAVRAHATRLLRAIDQLQVLPGAMTFRTAQGAPSLPDIRSTLEDCLRFDIGPIIARIRSEGATRGGGRLPLYVDDRLRQLRSEKTESDSRTRAIQTALRDYSQRLAAQQGEAREILNEKDSAGASQGLVPLLGRFLDRLQYLNEQAQKGEAEYRRTLMNELIDESHRAALLVRDIAYYTDLGRRLPDVGRAPNGSAAVVNQIKDRTRKAFDVVEKTTDQLSTFAQEFSAHNLQPAARLYDITAPVTEISTPPLSARSVAIAFALVLMLTLFIVPVLCIVYDARRRNTPT